MGRAIIMKALVGLAGVVIAAGADAPTAEPLWRAATAAVDVGSRISVVADATGDRIRDLLVAGWGPRGPHDVVLIDGAFGIELWRKRLEEGASAQALPIELPGGHFVLATREDVLTVIALGTGAVIREITLRAPIGELAAGHLDGDGVPDVVYSAGLNRNDILVALSGADLSELWSVAAEPDDSRFGDGFSRLATIDIGADGTDEVFVCENMRSVSVLSGDGATLWEGELGERTKYVPKGAVSGGPVVGDFLGGGDEQLAVGLWAGDLVVLDALDGEVLARRQFGADVHRAHARGRRLPRFLRAILLETGEPVNDLLAVELDGVSGRELVFGCSDGFVYSVSPRSDRVLWSFDSEGQVHDRPIGVDANGDGAFDVLAWDEDAAYLIDGRTGAALTGLVTGAEISAAVLADLGSDGGLELIELGRDGAVRAYVTGLPCARAPASTGCGE
jgi:outer membrane protein assembly factor BamB